MSNAILVVHYILRVRSNLDTLVVEIWINLSPDNCLLKIEQVNKKRVGLELKILKPKQV